MQIGDRVKGVAEFITDPVSAFKGLGNVFTYAFNISWSDCPRS